MPEDWATDEEISTFKPQRTSEPHYPGGRTLSIDQSNELCLIGGSDGIAGVYSLSENRVLHALKGGGGSITSGVWAGSRVVISTSAGRVKIFEGQEEVASFAAHAGEVSAVALHPSGDMIASVGGDKSYVLYDLTSADVVSQVYTDSGTLPLTLMEDITNHAGQLLHVCNFILMVIYLLLGRKMDRSSSSISEPGRKLPPSTWTEL
jgi:pre-mRNA-processing factor 19